MTMAIKKSVTELLGLPDPPRTGRERLVAAAIELFYRQGFGAVGIDRVISAAGVTKTTFYKHFESKDDLMVVWFNDPDFHGCMFMNTAAEFPNPHDPVHQAAAAHRRRSRDHWRDLAKAAGAARCAAETFADCFAALVEG